MIKMELKFFCEVISKISQRPFAKLSLPEKHVKLSLQNQVFSWSLEVPVEEILKNNQNKTENRIYFNTWDTLTYIDTDRKILIIEGVCMADTQKWQCLAK